VILDIQDTRLAEMKNQASKLLTDASALLSKPEKTAEDSANAVKMVEQAKAIKAELDTLLEIKEAGAAFAKVAIEAKKEGDDKPAPVKGYKTLGQFLQEIWLATHTGKSSPRLKFWTDPSEPDNGKHTGAGGWMESKDLVESIGASGGFLVPTEMDTTLLQWNMTGDNTLVESRATKIPMRRRAILIPALNQGGTTAGRPHWFGGVIVQWTEEAGEKPETEPSFRQIELVAHKLTAYTEASDELLEDSAVSLEAFLTQNFVQATQWYRQDAYINGTGAGQPLGVLNAPVTLTHQPYAANALNLSDFAGMLEKFQGSNPVWFMNRQWMSDLIQVTGPSGNASYVFINNMREGVPGTLFGYPIYFVEQMPSKGSDGSVLLADWSKYLIGDRQAVTVDSSKHFKFRNDMTSWRCVSRVDGQPWLNLPLTWSNGTTQTSPFVKLGAIAGGS
jgi:HK97 family phage major capsid protein